MWVYAQKEKLLVQSIFAISKRYSVQWDFKQENQY